MELVASGKVKNIFAFERVFREFKHLKGLV
jgi:hypothetical protein